MEQEKTNYTKTLINMILILVLALFLMQDNLFVLKNTNVLSGADTDVRLHLVTLEETLKQEMDWENVANAVIPSVVTILSSNEETGFSGSGSGVILSEDGFIITNAHVVGDIENNLSVVLPDETTNTSEDNIRYDGTLIGIDNYTDLAVLKIEATGLIPAEFGDSNEVNIAQGVMAIGFPGGLTLSPSATVTIGYVSAVNRPVDMGDGYIINSIQTDASLNPGNSGGALVNKYGQVIGIPSSKIVASGYEGLGFAIPSSVAQSIINDLIEVGHVKNRATLGIGGQFYNQTYSNINGVPVGVVVLHIYATQTEISGLNVGDIITKVEEDNVTSFNIINTHLQQKMPNDILEIKVYRNGVYIELSIVLSDYYEVFGD